MKYAMSFVMSADGEIDEGYDYSCLLNNDVPLPSWWGRYLEGFWDEGLFWCIVEWDDEEISS